MRSQITYFRYSLFPTLILFLGLAPFSLIFSLIFAPVFWRLSNGIISIILVFLLNLSVTAIFTYSYRVGVSRQGIKGSNYWGKINFVDWPDITEARYFRGFITAGFEFILISTPTLSKALWLPLFLHDMPRFQQLVAKYAGASNPLFIELKQLNTPARRLKKAEEQIKNAWQAGIVSGTITLIWVLCSVAVDNVLNGFIDASAFVDVCLIYGLSFGIFKKSRIAAVIMLVYFVSSQIWVAIALKRVPGLLAWIFVSFYAGGVQGTFTYQKLSKP